jgi:hypothetical protein
MDRLDSLDRITGTRNYRSYRGYRAAGSTGWSGIVKLVSRTVDVVSSWLALIVFALVAGFFVTGLLIALHNLVIGIGFTLS